MLLERVRAAIEVDRQTRAGAADQTAVRERLAHLTPREREVMELLRRQLVEQYRVEFTPTFISFDAAKEQWRGVGRLDATTVRRLAGETR